VVHHAADAFAVRVRFLRQARRHQSDEVGLDLEVDVVGVHVVLRVAGHRRLDAPRSSRRAPALACQRSYCGRAERLAVLLGGGVEADAIHHRRERHLDVEVVLVERVRDALRRPRRQVALDDLPVRLELGRRAEGHADHLARPAAAHLVLERRPRQLPHRCPRLQSRHGERS
jgi:hypothetical protein